jgi:hypothetical protein
VHAAHFDAEALVPLGAVRPSLRLAATAPSSASIIASRSTCIVRLAPQSS